MLSRSWHRMASNGIRDEEVFPTPILLEAQPTLVGYYRLLLGVGQKTFYRGGTGMGPLKSMETTGILRANQRTLIPQFCTAMGQALATLIRQLSPMVTARDVHELPLLTLGGQFQGASNVSVGQQASTDVFLAIDEIVKTHVEDRTSRSIRINNSAGRPVWIILGSDPNVSIREDFGGGLRNKVAIQIKGGTDVANVHNRAGEAEKSHLKAKDEDYRDFWTIIAIKGVNRDRLQTESPTTNSWFDASEVFARAGPDWQEFKSRISEAVGIPES